MSVRTIARHVLVVVACVAGVAGMGMAFSGVMHADVGEVTRGMPLLLLGGWWAGRDLGRSMLAARERHPNRSHSSEQR